MRPIDADAMKRYIDCGHLRPPTEVCFSELDMVHMLDKAPTIDVVPMRHGHWVIFGNAFFARYKCSVCDNGAFDRYFAYGARYCPICGARMDENNG